MPKSGDAVTVQLFNSAIVRCAAWPLESLDAFGSERLAAAAQEIERLAASIDARRPGLLAELYNAIALVSEPHARATLLDQRRRIRATAAPLIWSDEVEVALRELPASLHARVELERAERQQMDAARKSFSALYADEIERECAALHALTGTCEFRRALILANPELARRWEQQIASAAPIKRSRRVQTEASVLFYLFRAAARPTPGALWAGVAPCSHGAKHEVEIVPAVRRYSVSINLEPFARMVEHLRLQPRYRCYPAVRMSPSAYREDETWWYQPPCAGKHDWRQLRPDPSTAALLELFADRAPHDLPESGAELLRLGILQSTLRFPPNATDCWAALHEVADQLRATDREYWLTKVRLIRDYCQTLSENLERIAPQELDRMRTLLEKQVEEMYVWAGLSEAVPHPILLIDFHAGFEVRLSTAMWSALTAAVTESLSFYECHGMPEQLRRVTLDALLDSEHFAARQFLEMARCNGAALEYPGPQIVHEGTRRLMSRIQTEVVGRQRSWYDRLMLSAPPAGNRVAPAEMCAVKPYAGFDGTIVLSIARGCRVRVEWGRPNAFCLTARFLPLLDGAGITLLAQMRDWYRGWSDWGFEAAEVVGADVLNPNASTRLPIATRVLSASGGEAGLANLSVKWAQGTPRAWVDDGRQALIPVYNCTGRIGVKDAASDALYRLALAHGWEFAAYRLFPRLNEGGIARLSLACGAVLSPARWFLSQQTVERLAALKDAEQYLAWRRHMNALAVPDRVRVATEAGPDEPLLYLSTTSPLAVRSLFAKIASRPRPLEFIEEHGEPAEQIVTDSQGRHYCSEFIIAWKDPAYWEAVDPAARETV